MAFHQKAHGVHRSLSVMLAIHYFQVSCLISLHLQILRGQLTVTSRPREHMLCLCRAIRGLHSLVSNWGQRFGSGFICRRAFGKGSMARSDTLKTRHGHKDQGACERGSWSSTPLALPPVPCPEPGRLSCPQESDAQQSQCSLLSSLGSCMQTSGFSSDSETSIAFCQNSPGFLSFHHPSLVPG